MGVSMSVYFGPYIKITKDKFERESKKNACNNENCKKYKHPANSKFCPECGSAIETITVKEMVNFRYYDIQVKYDIEDDVFYLPEYSNCILSNTGAYSMGDEGGDINILKDIETNKAIKVSAEWQQLIDALEKENIPYERAYGVVSYWS